MAQFRSNPDKRIFLSSVPMIIRQLPVNSSAPHITTIIRPTGNTAPMTTLPIPKVVGSEVRLKDAIREACAPSAMKAPAIIARRKSFPILPSAFATEPSDCFSMISRGVSAVIIITPNKKNNPGG